MSLADPAKYLGAMMILYEYGEHGTAPRLLILDEGDSGCLIVESSRVTPYNPSSRLFGRWKRKIGGNDTPRAQP